MSAAIEFNNISKQYRLGLVSTRTLSHDLNRWWKMDILRQEDPYLKIGEVNDRAHKGSSEYVWALKDINFEVEQGDVVGIIGKNGAGKSTLLKILSKVTTPTTGTIKAKGRIASLLEVGTGFHPEMTGRENIYMNGAIMGMTRNDINRKFDEIVDFAGVERYIDTPVKRYSSGMTVRLGFAVAAFLEPEILVVDEVLAVGDAEFQKKAIGKMQDVSKGDGRTVLFVSHNMGAVKSLCKTGLVLKNGYVDYIGSAVEAIDCYIKNSTPDNDYLIISRINKISSKISIQQISANNSELGHLLLSNYHPLTLKINGILYEQIPLSLEVRIYDENDIPLFFYCPEIETGIIQNYNVGQFSITRTFSLPHMLSKGRYYCDIFLTNPNKEGYIDIIKGITIDYEGYTTPNGQTFSYTRGHGYIYLQ